MRRQFADAGVRVHDLGVPHPAGARGPRIVRLTNTATTLAAAIQKLRRLIISSRADVVDAHLETALYTAVPAAVSAGVPVSITLYSELDLWKILDSRSIRQFLFPAIRRLNLRRCSAIITDAKIRATELARYIGGAAPPLHVIAQRGRLAKAARPRSEVRGDFCATCE